MDLEELRRRAALGTQGWRGPIEREHLTKAFTVGEVLDLLDEVASLREQVASYTHQSIAELPEVARSEIVRLRGLVWYARVCASHAYAFVDPEYDPEQLEVLQTLFEDLPSTDGEGWSQGAMPPAILPE